MGLFDWWRGSKQQLDAEVVSEALIGEITDLVVKIANPRLVVVRRYREKLAEPVGQTVVFLRKLAGGLLPEREASAAGWVADPTMRAFFARPDDLLRVLNSSSELRELFDSRPDLAEAHAVLGMQMREQQVLGMKLQGDVIQREVPQTVLNFSDYKARIVAATAPELRRRFGQRIFEQLALQALDRIGDAKDRRKDLEQHRVLLKSRQRLLQQGAFGMKSAFGDTPLPPAEEMGRIESLLEDNEREMGALGLGANALEYELEELRETLARSCDSISLDTRRIRLDSMNVEVEAASSEPSQEIEFNVLEIAGTPPLRRAGALVRFSRADLRSRQSLLDDAARYLG